MSLDSKENEQNKIVILARNKESALQIAKLIVSYLEKVFLGNDTSELEKIKVKNKPFKTLVLTETFDGRVMLSEKGDMTNPKFLDGLVESPFYTGTAKEFIENNGVTTDINHDSAQIMETKDHLYFVQAMRIFFRELNSPLSVSFKDKDMECLKISNFNFFEHVR